METATEETTAGTAGANGVSEPVSAAAAQAPTAGAPALDPERKRQNDQNAATGRKLAETQRQLQSALDMVSGLTGKVQELDAKISTREAAEDQAYLQSLSPEDRLQELDARLGKANEEIATLKAPKPEAPATPQSSAPLTDEEKARIKAENKQKIIDAINEEFALDGDFLVKADDDALDERTPQTFAGSARTMAKLLHEAKSKGQENPVAAAKQPAKPTPNNEGKIVFDSEAAFQEAVNRAASGQQGLDGPLSAQPVASGSGEGPTSEDFKNATRKFNSKTGGRAVIQDLKRLRAQAEEALTGGTR